MKTITIKYSKEGRAISDFEIDKTLESISEKEIFHTSSHMIVVAAQVAHKQGRIKLNLYIGEKHVRIDRNGTLECYDGLRDAKDYYMYLI